MFWIKNQLRFLPHPLNLLRDLAFFHHFHTFFSQFSHFQSPYQSIATNFASLPGSTKALGEAARHLQPFQPLKKPDFYRVLWWIYLCVTQNSLGKKNKHLGIYYQMSMFHWLIWHTPDKRPNKTYCNTNFQSSKTNNSIQIQHVYCKQPTP